MTTHATTPATTSEMVIEFELNGALRRARRGTTVADLIRELALRPEAVAVERNARLVRRTARDTAAIEPGDRLEIVTLVGGG